MWEKVICSKFCYKYKETTEQWLKAEFWGFKGKKVHLKLKYIYVIIAEYIQYNLDQSRSPTTSIADLSFVILSTWKTTDSTEINEQFTCFKCILIYKGQTMG